MDLTTVNKHTELHRRWEDACFKLKALDMLIRSEAEEFLRLGNALRQGKLLVNSSGRPLFKRMEGKTLIPVEAMSGFSLAELLRSRQRTQEELASMQHELQVHSDENKMQEVTSFVQ